MALLVMSSPCISLHDLVRNENYRTAKRIRDPMRFNGVGASAKDHQFSCVYAQLSRNIFHSRLAYT
jgi:hypothetical protein